MDRRERFEDPTVAVRAALRDWQSQIYTQCPGIYQGPGTGKQTANVQPAIKHQVLSPEGVWTFVNLPVCLDCPIIFPGAGGFQITFPVVAGDEGIIFFAQRCIDAWWQSGGIQPQAEIRMHDLSDGFFLPAQLSQPLVPAAFSSDTCQVKTLDGEAYVELTSGHVVNIVAPGGINLNGPLTMDVGDLTIQGNLIVTGDVTGEGGGPLSGSLQVAGDVTAGVGTGDRIGLRTHLHQYQRGTTGLIADSTSGPDAGT